MQIENNIEIRKFNIDKNIIIKEKLDLTYEIEFLIRENIKMYSKERNLSYINEKIYTIFSNKYKQHIFNNGGSIYAAYLNNEIVGVIHINNQFYIESLFIKEEYKRNGIGKKLMIKVLNDFKDKDITLTSSKDALDFYKKLDFIEYNKSKEVEESINLMYIRKY